MAKVRVPIRASIEDALRFALVGDNKLWMKSRIAEFRPPSSEDIVEEIAGLALVCTM